MFIDLFTYLKETFFTYDLSKISNYDTTDVERFLPLLIVGVCYGMFAAACISYYNTHFLGKIVRKLYSLSAFSPSEAKTLDELCCNNCFVRKNLTSDSVLSKYVRPAEEPLDKSQVNKAKFYLFEEQKYIADKRFKEVGGGILSLVIAFLVCTALCFVLLYYVPDILQLADNSISMIYNGD